jgi:two-component system, LytTR family, sensor kinase
MQDVTAMFDPKAAQTRESARRVRRAGLLISLGYWTALLIVLTGLALLDGWETPGTFTARCVNTVLAVALTALMARVVTIFTRGSFAAKASLLIFLTLVVSTVYFLATFHIFRLFGGNDSPMLLASALRMILYWFAQFLGWSALLLALIYHHEVQDRERQLSSLKDQAYGAQMRALRYQINPHFLFNTLNALAALIEERELPKAERMVLSLSGFLRSTLALDPLQDITLAEEIEIQSRYLEIEGERFSDRLTIEVDVPEALRSALLPSLILQPLVENAVKHGVGTMDGPTAVRVRAEADGDILLVHVENDAPAHPVPRQGEGVGLRNVAERLRARFGGAAQLSGEHLGSLFRATIRLPLRTARA